MEEQRTHTITLVRRGHLTLTGIEHVDNFDDDSIVLVTDMGMLTIRGHKLRIQTLDLERGHFEATGDFDAVVYGRKKNSGTRNETIWKKMWR